MYMIMFVLNDIDYLDDILEAWLEIGISGATIVESSGLHRRLKKHIHMRYAYDSSPLMETGNITLFAIVPDQKKVQAGLAAIEEIIGDLDKPNTGVFSSWPLYMTKGIPASAEEE